MFYDDTGDIVKVYNQDVNDEYGCREVRTKIRNTYLLYEKPKDIVLVIQHESNNEFWKIVYLWKEKKIKSCQAKQMFWLQDQNGRAIRISNAAEQLDEIAPRKVMQPYFESFEKYL